MTDNDALETVVEQTISSDMPPLDYVPGSDEPGYLAGSDRSDTLIPPPEVEVIAEPHVEKRDEEPEARLLNAGAAALYVSPEPILGGAVVPRADTCWRNMSNPVENCYVAAGAYVGKAGPIVLCDFYELSGPNGSLVVREVLIHSDHFAQGDLCPYNKRPSWTQGSAVRMPPEDPQIPKQAQPPAEAPAIDETALKFACELGQTDATIIQLAGELGQSPAQVQRLVTSAVQAMLAFVQTKGVLETSPVLDAFIQQIKESPILNAFRELLGLKQLEKAVGAEQIGNDANLQQIVDYINNTLEPKIDALEKAMAATQQALGEVPPKGESSDLSEFDDDEDEVVDVEDDDWDDDVDVDEPEIAEPEPGPPPRSSKPPAAPKASPGRPKGSRDKKPRKISTTGRKTAKKAASKLPPNAVAKAELGPSGRAKAKGRRGPSIAAKKAASKAAPKAAPKVDSKTTSIDAFLKGAENVKVRRLLKNLPESKLNQFIAAAKKGIPDFALTTWKVQDQADFFGWFARSKHAAARR